MGVLAAPSKAEQLVSMSKEEYNSLCISILLSQNLLCIVILILPTPNNKKYKFRCRENGF